MKRLLSFTVLLFCISLTPGYWLYGQIDSLRYEVVSVHPVLGTINNPTGGHTAYLSGGNGIKPSGSHSTNASGGFIRVSELGLGLTGNEVQAYEIRIGYIDLASGGAGMIWFGAGSETVSFSNPLSSTPPSGMHAYMEVPVPDAYRVAKEISLNTTLTNDDVIYLFMNAQSNSHNVAIDYVELIRINPNAPEFTDADDIYDFSTNEGEQVGTLVGVVTATDPDVASLGQSIVYSIESGNAGGKFAIDPATGAITIANVIDAETDPLNYTLVVRATDAGGPLGKEKYDVATVNISVADMVNEHAPVIASQTRTIAENSPGGTLVGSVVTAFDPDGHNIVSYSIVGGNTGNAFSIDNSGQIRVNAAVLNYETRPTYPLTVRVCDDGVPGSRCSEAVVTVNLTDIDENPNAPSISNAAFSVNEHSSYGTVVGTPTASDADVGQTLKYRIVGGATNKFGIDSVTGAIFVKGVLDRETGPASYTLTIEVSDNGEPVKTATGSVTISINNVDENTLAQPYLEVYKADCSGLSSSLDADVMGAVFMDWRVISGSATIANPNLPSTSVSFNDGDTVTFKARAGLPAGDNLIENGDFESGGVGFTSEYAPFGPGSPGHYGVGPNARSIHSYFLNTPGRGGSGNYFFADGADEAGVHVYMTTLDVKKDSVYAFTTYAANGHNSEPNASQTAHLQFTIINGASETTIGDILLPLDNGVWHQFSASYTHKGPDATITVAITNANTNGTRNDFFLDDISFYRIQQIIDAQIEVACDMPMPVELVSFTGKKKDGINILQWVTATEKDNDYFVIERSANGIDFVAIGVVYGNGTYEGIKNYTYNDEEPLNGINYYRLKQVDFNGDFAYSKIIAIQNKQSVDIDIYPNPSTDGLINISLLAMEQPYQLDITNMDGKSVYSLSGNSVPAQVQVSDLAKGVYIVRLYIDSEVVVKKLLVY